MNHVFMSEGPPHALGLFSLGLQLNRTTAYGLTKIAPVLS